MFEAGNGEVAASRAVAGELLRGASETVLCERDEWPNPQRWFRADSIGKDLPQLSGGRGRPIDAADAS